MCGIAGILFKQQEGPIGEILIKMLADLNRRGPDSTGLALYSNLPKGNLVARIKVDEDARRESVDWEASLVETAQEYGKVRESSRAGQYVRLVMDYDGSYEELTAALEASGEGVEVFSMGQHLEIVKQMGKANALDATYGLSSIHGTHGISHTRMATESRVDISHSHPFWARPFSDIAVVHNGHITNYHKLRRRLEIKGHHFNTGNDSEVIAVYIADMMQQGATLDDAVRSTVTALDGSFTYLVATGDSMGFARDQFAMKPLIITETDEFVAVASEESALRKAFPFELEIREASARQVRTWRLERTGSAKTPEAAMVG
ncbi:MAG: glutamine amidotransferase [Ktedonobacteraceae bacterium]